MRDRPYFRGQGDPVDAIALYLRCRRMAGIPSRCVAIAVHPVQLAAWTAAPPDARIRADPRLRVCGLPVIADPRLPRPAWRPVLAAHTTARRRSHP